jgi:5'-nucleotidase
MLQGLGEILVVAPNGPRSGASCSINVTATATCKLITQKPGLAIYGFTGTPVDCVKFGLQELTDRVPDLVVGGINHGDNSSINVHYSGTMGIAKEGCMKGIPSIGFSLDDYSADANFEPMRDYVRKIVSVVLEKGLPRNTCLNVNFPKGESYKGIKICRQMNAQWTKEWVKMEHPRGGQVYWLTGEMTDRELEEGTDGWALANGYVAITPTTVDATSYSLLDEMKNWNL